LTIVRCPSTPVAAAAAAIPAGSGGVNGTGASVDAAAETGESPNTRRQLQLLPSLVGHAPTETADFAQPGAGAKQWRAFLSATFANKLKPSTPTAHPTTNSSNDVLQLPTPPTNPPWAPVDVYVRPATARVRAHVTAPVRAWR
jgi:hypothetical protein